MVTAAVVASVAGAFAGLDAAGAPEAAIPVAEAQETNGIDARQLIDADVENPDGKHLGTLSEIVEHPETGAPAVAIVRRSGFLGLGEQEVAVPWDLLRVIPGRTEAVILDTSDETLEAAPEPDADLLAIPEMFEEHWQVIEDYWAAQQQP